MSSIPNNLTTSSRCSGAKVTIDFTHNGIPLCPSIAIYEPAESAAVNSISPEARLSNTLYEYSGRHDHGDLPTNLKDSGPNAVTVHCMQQAKRESDKFLTACINEQFGNDATNQDDNRPKKMRPNEGSGKI